MEIKEDVVFVLAEKFSLFKKQIASFLAMTVSNGLSLRKKDE